MSAELHDTTDRPNTLRLTGKGLDLAVSELEAAQEAVEALRSQHDPTGSVLRLEGECLSLEVLL